jgi:hypothetical protein
LQIYPIPAITRLEGLISSLKPYKLDIDLHKNEYIMGIGGIINIFIFDSSGSKPI